MGTVEKICHRLVDKSFQSMLTFTVGSVWDIKTRPVVHNSTVIALSSLSSDDDIDFNMRANCFFFSSLSVMTQQDSSLNATTCVLKPKCACARVGRS